MRPFQELLMEVASTLSWFEVFRPPKEEFPNWNAGTSMISKSQEETEVSERLEEKALEADMRRSVRFANSQR
jgi:hypothetical protein